MSYGNQRYSYESDDSDSLPTWQESTRGSHSYAPPQHNVARYDDDMSADSTVLLQPNYKPSFAWLVMVKGARPGQLFPLSEKKALRVGRRGDFEICLSDDKSVSNEHAKVYREGENFVIHDLASANGTFVNGEKVYHRFLQENDAVLIGQTLLVFKHIREEDING